MNKPPRIENAPGMIWRRRKTGWEARWQPRTDLRKRGFPTPSQRLWFGKDGTMPSEQEQAYMADTCRALQGEMLIWGRGGIPQECAFTGTIASLIDAYQTDRDSNFRKVRPPTREHYAGLCERIKADFGDKLVSELKTRDILHWNESQRVSMGHALVAMLRTLMSFGMTILENDDCATLSARLSKMRFKMSKPRESRLTAEQVNLIRTGAHAAALPSIALAQAFQFELMLRQKDVIGEWLRFDESETGLVIGHHKWLRGLTWQEIDSTLVLKHITSKRQKMIEVDLRRAPMVLEELDRQFPGWNGDRAALPNNGPIILREGLGIPWRADEFRRQWRKLANAAGIPKTVRNMDTRAGAITEATEAGAELEAIKHAATHSDIAMTQRYARGAVEKTAGVMDKRAAHRNKTGS